MRRRVKTFRRTERATTTMVKILQGYKVKVEQSKQDPTVKFTVVSDSHDNNLELTIYTIRGELYFLYFLNNQFFEISESDLLDCVEDILSGNYNIDNRKTMRIIAKTNNTIPERVESDSDWKEMYKKLPRSFNK
jgi:hypothetical protein